MEEKIAKFFVDTIENLQAELTGLRKVINENINDNLVLEKKVRELEDLNDQQTEHIMFLEKRLSEARDETQMTNEKYALALSALGSGTEWKPLEKMDFEKMVSDFFPKSTSDKSEEEYNKRIDAALDDHEGEGI